MKECINIPPRLSVAALGCMLLMAIGCQTYSPLPFDPTEILKEVQTNRNRLKPGNALTFAEALKLMSDGNSELKELRGRYKQLKVVADIPTPLPNPEVEIGAQIGKRMGSTPENKTQPFAALGFAIPLGPRLKREDDLNAVKAETARLAVVAKHRDLFLSLRSAFANHALAAQRLKQRNALKEVIRQSELTSERLLKAGQIGELELNQTKIVNRLENLKQIDDQLTAETAAASLANLLGVTPGALSARQACTLPDPPKTMGSMTELEKALIQNNTTLSALRMAFWEHDAELKLELAKQYPDLNLGLGFEQEPGEKAQVFELGVGLELPLFDRNKQGIAQALNARKAAKTAYETELARLLTRLEVSVRKYNLIRRKTEAMEELLPLAAKNQKDALKLTNLGTFNFMRYLDVSKEYAELAMEHVEQKAELWSMLTELEQLIGRPIAQFPDSAANTISKDKERENTP